MSVKVLYWSSEQDADIDRALENERDVEWRSVSTLPALRPLLRDSDALILPGAQFSAQLSRELVPKNAPALRWIHLTSAGLWTVPNLLITPHIAAAGQSAPDREYLAGAHPGERPPFRAANAIAKSGSCRCTGSFVNADHRG